LSQPLLLDEMFSDSIARQLREQGHDVVSVVADSALISLPDEQILAYAAEAGRALVTANIKDFMPLDSQYRASGHAHAGLILVSTKTFPQDRSFTSAITKALGALLGEPDSVSADQVLFLRRQ
jgi:predicted nuclease of predicted toxin-antitoxin system